MRWELNSSLQVYAILVARSQPLVCSVNFVSISAEAIHLPRVLVLLHWSSIGWIMSLQSLAIHQRHSYSLLFKVSPKLLLSSHGLPNKFQEDDHVHPTLMEIVIGNLPDLPQEILIDIFCLLEIPDLVRAGSVCSSWNSAYARIISIGLYRHLQTPCLIYTTESAGESVACLYSLAENKAYRLTLPEPPVYRRYLIGSSHGWLITVDE